MSFLRELWSYITDASALARSRTEKVRWSYFFRLHLVVGFLVTLVFVPRVIDAFRDVQRTAAQIPAGIVAEKKGDVLKIGGLVQPKTFSDGLIMATVDTSSSAPVRAASSTVLIARDYLELAAPGARPQKIFWRDEQDFVLKLNEVAPYLQNHERAIVITVSLVLFVYFLLMKMVNTLFIVGFWTVLSVVMLRLVQKRWLPVREVFAAHLLAITGPLLIWVVLTAGGFEIATIVEIIVFVVYSVFVVALDRVKSEK